MDFQKIPAESDLLALLSEGEVAFPPLSIAVEDAAPAGRGGPDAFVALGGNERRFRFVVQCSRLSTPKALKQLIDEVRRYARPPEFYPLVFVPYLPEDRLAELQAAGVSGIDLCGNGVVIVPNELFVYRTGQPNRFRSEAEIKNVFRGASALVARAFLVLPEFESVQAAERMIRARGGQVTLPTISKVCKSLESLLVIERTREPGTAARRLRLLQPDKLLEQLAANYVPPAVTRTVRGKARLTPKALRARFQRLEPPKARVVQTGFGSVGNYAVMATEPVQDFYCSDAAAVVEALGDAFEMTDRFANVTFRETRDDAVYFDRRPGLVASPVQTYLELATGDKRSRETAEQVRRVIVGALATARSEA